MLEKVGNNMKSTGVVRRVDDLGRIVIPKEIRRNLKIRDGEEVEIYVGNEGIILKKFSKMADFSSIAKKIIDVVSPLIGKTILVCDRDVFIAGSGDLKKNYLGKDISHNVDKSISKGITVVENNISSIELIDGMYDRYSHIICPIVSYGDVIGGVIAFSANQELLEFDVTVIRLIVQFLEKCVED